MSMSLNPVKANIGVMMDQLQKITPKNKNIILGVIIDKI